MFWIDASPVSNQDFLDFVSANPKWQRSKIKPIFADVSYLSHWAAACATLATQSAHAAACCVLRSRTDQNRRAYRQLTLQRGLTMAEPNRQRHDPDHLRSGTRHRGNLLRGDPNDIIGIENLLDVKYKHLPNGEFSHSNIITQLEGLYADSAELIEGTKALINAK